MKKIYPLFISVTFISFPFSLAAQVIHYPPSSSFVSTCLYSNKQVNTLAERQNPAALVKLHAVTASVYGEKRFGLKELGYYEMAVSVPATNSGMGFDAMYFGKPEYNETGFGLSYARSLGKALSLGIRFNFYQVSLQGYGNAMATGFAIGGEYHLSDHLNFAFSADNPFGGKYNRQVNEKTASVFRMGIGFEPSDELAIQGELIKEENLDAAVRIQLRYAIKSSIFFDVGFITLPASPFAGLGFSLRALRLSIFAGYQRQLGFTPGLLLEYSFTKTKN